MHAMPCRAGADHMNQGSAEARNTRAGPRHLEPGPLLYGFGLGWCEDRGSRSRILQVADQAVAVTNAEVLGMDCE